MKVRIGAMTAAASLALAVAAAPAAQERPRPLLGASYVKGASAVAPAAAAATSTATATATKAATEMEMNEQIVSDFLKRKEQAERAQRAILAKLRQELDRRRAEFDDARRRYDDARARYAEIVGPLPRQGVMSPTDPRLPYEFEVRRTGPSPEADRSGPVSRQPGGVVR